MHFFLMDEKGQNSDACVGLLILFGLVAFAFCLPPVGIPLLIIALLIFVAVGVCGKG